MSCAAKFIPLRSKTKSRAHQERDILASLSHDRITRLLDEFETRKTLILILELYPFLCSCLKRLGSTGESSFIKYLSNFFVCLFFSERKGHTQSFSALQDSTALWELHCSPQLLLGEKNQTCTYKCECVLKHQNYFLEHLEVMSSVSVRSSLGEHEENAEQKPQNQQK